ncbi:aspartate transaminase [Wigglesworthia glossinidia endosymbiont of Glossina morsitans morsitans (Yale colony)]|uniref:Aminotransferase n=1 Tax=Wigglesworthia glossinidia endosymbiont of Glossina morsitans morsitans (Yale colony) TaxID=1142511 RepID=H6Q5I9_WIGGL|nr:amino acid aminotransferase [Wigglesworthia glossinidia]AFA41472.1 aspartate transaminase [Wigglesworthia glossinidia endosymbiont of Glossina morsitans morsitans (Yale colony)]
MFEFTKPAPLDPVLGLKDIINQDQRKNKINLGIGIYTDTYGNTPILDCVKQAESILIETETTKNYLNIEGLPSFIEKTKKIIFGEDTIQYENIASAQTPGGTSALKIIADFLIKNTQIRRIWISNPSWPNHKKIFYTSGFEIREYPYFNKDKNVINFFEMKDCLNNIDKNDAVILHGCCHNPTGMDLKNDQWIELAKIAQKKCWIPIFDYAYQGFAYGLKEDMLGIKVFSKFIQEFIVCHSYSKNISIYNERVGTCNIVTKNQKHASIVFSQLKSVIRSNYSNPPAHGGSIVNLILSNHSLFNLWLNELSNMRNRIILMRKLFVETLYNLNCKKNFNFILKQNGMFSFIGLNYENVLKLRKIYGVYVVDSGRLNFAAMTESNILYICKAIKKILKK